MRYKVGLIGYGSWGPKIAFNFARFNNSRITVISDIKEERLQEAKKEYPSVDITLDYKSIISNPDIDIVVIATPAISHFRIASEALTERKHIFIEKPMTLATKHAQSLIDLGKAKKRKIMVGHVTLYSRFIQRIKEIITSGDIGDINYIFMQRLGYGTSRQDVSVLWDLAPHDVSIALYLLKEKPLIAKYSGIANSNSSIHDVAILNLIFPQNILVSIQNSWLHYNKTRKITIVGSKKMLECNDLTGKIDMYNGKSRTPFQVASNEPLYEQLRHFIDCIQYDKEPLSNGQNGLDVVSILESAEL